MTCIFEGCDIFILPKVFTVACKYVTIKYRNKTKRTERPMLPAMNQFSSLYTIECVRCHAIKNKIKKYATDKVKKL